MVMMETIYPSKDGVTIFEDPKLKQRLVKEMKKGNIKPPSMSDSLGTPPPPALPAGLEAMLSSACVGCRHR